MKAVILAGGLGTRLSEETHLRPKPLVEIGGQPILWHILKLYSHHGINNFIICAGYKGYLIKEYFANYFLHTSDVTFDITNNDIVIERKSAEPWRVTVVDTGEATMTGGRLARVATLLGEEPFCCTYGDGVADIDIPALVNCHLEHGRLATVTAVQPPGRYGTLKFRSEDEAFVDCFQEKPQGDGAWINGGFFVLSPPALEFIREGDSTVWEKTPLEELARSRELVAYRHHGFWRAMDTLRDRTDLDTLWATGSAPWKVW